VTVPSGRDEARELRLSRQVYRLRTLGLALGFISIAAVFRERDVSRLAWAPLIFHGILWPHIAWFRARTSTDPHRTERVNLVIDSTFGGVFVALMQFCLLPSVLIVAMLSMDKIGWGPRFLARTSAAMATACLVTALATRAAFVPFTSMTEIVASLPLMVAYPLAVAFASLESGRVARARKREVEQVAALREQLAHVGRVGTLGEMAAGLAHELNQPLTAIHLEASAAIELNTNEMPESREGLLEAMSVIRDQSLRAGDIVRRMRTFARRSQPKREATDIRPLIREVLALVDHDLRLSGIETTLAVGGNLPAVVVDRIEIQQVLVNLIRNAMEAMADTPIATRRLTIETAALPGHVRVTVADSGPGVDPAIAERIFHPFQSTKAAGLGLGLSISQSLIEAHGGRIGTMTTAAPPAGGAAFFFELPTARLDAPTS
jgi:C4-dicarboxylate-specific signal transduction histidine kinase